MFRASTSSLMRRCGVVSTGAAAAAAAAVRRCGTAVAPVAGAYMVDARRFRSYADPPTVEDMQAASAAAAAKEQEQQAAASKNLKQPEAPAGLQHADYESYSPMQDFESDVRIRMQQKLGEGTYDLYRAVYKDLCDEMRREEIARAPPPVAGWTVEHKTGTRYVAFRRTRRPEEDFEVVVQCEVAIVDPRTINEVMQFLNWYPMEILIRREGYVCHIAACYVESQPQVRGVRIYHDDKDDPNGPRLDMAASGADMRAMFERTNLRYDGPFHGHLELDLITECFDMMLDVGCDCYFMRMVADWIAYLEHVEHTRWLLNVLDAAAPQVRHPVGDEDRFAEEDFVAREERILLDQTAEEWMPQRTM
jgi:hypothetical protein